MKANLVNRQHALVAYIPPAGVNKEPAVLHYALVEPGSPKPQPDYYHPKATTSDRGPASADG